jgi:hypothetical protein
MYQDFFLTPNNSNKYSVSSWMNPKFDGDGGITVYIQPTSPGTDLEINWLPSSATVPGMTPLMCIYSPLPATLDDTWSPPPAVEVS